MPAARARLLLIVSVVGLAIVLVACATILGVDEPMRRAATSTSDAADSEAPSTDEDDATTPPIGDDIDAGCVGPSCPCGTDVDCRDSLYRKCVNGQCMACTTEPDSCPVGRFCLAGLGADAGEGESALNECAPGCTLDTQCAAPTPYCNSAVHQCVGCRSKADCPIASQDCTPSGLCADKCDSDGGACGSLPGYICCGGFCVDSQKDYLNCNGCGVACLTPQGVATTCCSGTCINTLKNVNNCGSCGTACVTTNGAPKCTAGTCNWTCNAGFAHCAGAFNTGCETNTTNDTNRCSGCARNCLDRVLNVEPSSISCVASLCTYSGACNAGFADCNAKTPDGCECKDCGHKDQPCCTDGTPECVPTRYCDRTVNTCKNCKKGTAKCTDAHECCSKKCENEKCAP